MTISNEYIEDQDYPDDDESARLAEGFPVRIVSDASKTVKEAAPEFGACMTWTIPQLGINSPIQILPRRIYRHKAQMLMVSNSGATSLVISNRIDNLTTGTPQGITYPMPAAFPFSLMEWESQQPAYAIAVGGTVVLSVQDESFGD